MVFLESSRWLSAGLGMAMCVSVPLWGSKALYGPCVTCEGYTAHIALRREGIGKAPTVRGLGVVWCEVGEAYLSREEMALCA